MKRTIITLVLGLLVLSSLYVNAQDVIVKKDNSTILSKVTKVSQTEIEYKKCSNLDGPTYIVAVSEVLRINYSSGDVDLFVESNSLGINNEIFNDADGGLMERSGKHLVLDGKVLTDDEVLNLVGSENYRTYLEAKRQMTIGRTFTAILISSIGLSALGGLIFLNDEHSDFAICTMFTAVLIPISIPFVVFTKPFGRQRLNWLANEYNKQHQGYSLNLSPSLIRCNTPQSQNNYALGMTLRFSF